MMHFEYRLPLAACILSLCCLSYGQHGEVFERHRSDILAGRTNLAEGVRFGVARETEPQDDFTLIEIAGDGSYLKALDNLFRETALSEIRWPDTLSATVSEELKNIVLSHFAASATLRGLTTVLKDFNEETKTWTCVVAVNAEQLDAVPRLTFEELRSHALKDSNVLYSNLPLFILRALRTTLKPLPPDLDTSVWEPIYSTTVFESEVLVGLARVVGHYPIGSAEPDTSTAYTEGMALYGKGRLKDAYAAFLKALNTKITFDALNMAGNTGRRIGRLREAVLCLLHAAYLKPASPYPWVHLAHIAKFLELTQLANACCTEAEKRKPDAWSRSQIDILRNVPPSSGKKNTRDTSPVSPKNVPSKAENKINSASVKSPSAPKQKITSEPETQIQNKAEQSTSSQSRRTNRNKIISECEEPPPNHPEDQQNEKQHLNRNSVQKLPDGVK